MKNLVFTTTIISSLILVGCGGTSNDENWDKIVNDNDFIAGELYSEKVNEIIPSFPNRDHVKDDFYVGATAIDVVQQNRDNLPRMFFENVSVYESKEMKIDDVGKVLYRDFDILTEFVDQTRQQNDPNDPNQTQQNNQSPLQENDFQNINNTTEFGGQQNSIFGNLNAEGEVEDEELKFSYSYTGDLRGLLDYISVQIDKKWQYDSEAEKVYFYDFQTEKFELLQYSEEVVSEGSINTGSGGSQDAEGGSGSTSNSQSTRFSSNLNAWQDIQNNINNMISNTGSASFDSAQGSVIVRDNDYVLATIRQYVSELNRDAAKQVVIDMQVINIKTRESNSMGVNWQNINRSLTNSFLGNNVSAAVNLSGPRGSSSPTFNISNSNQELLLDVLNEYGTVNVTNSISGITMNNKPIPIQVNTERPYRSGEESIENISDDDEFQGNTTRPIIETANEGVTLTVTPRIQDQQVILQYTLNLSVIDEFIDVGGNQLPILSNKNFVQRVIASNGRPLIVGAFEREVSNASKSGPFSNNLWFFGGRQANEKQVEHMLIIITPYIVKN